jgi:hypothetical protein
MTELWAVIAHLDSGARVVAVTFTADACEWLRQVVSASLRAAAQCVQLGRAA